MSSISFSNALGIHEQALYLRQRRADVLANNLANADTPNFKARDIDFQAALAQATAAPGTTSADAPTRTDPRHLSLASATPNGDLMYRIPSQPSIDGNTVEENMAMARFAENSQKFEASLYFLNSQFKGLKTAISGQA